MSLMNPYRDAARGSAGQELSGIYGELGSSRYHFEYARWPSPNGFRAPGVHNSVRRPDPHCPDLQAFSRELLIGQYTLVELGTPHKYDAGQLISPAVGDFPMRLTV